MYLYIFSYTWKNVTHMLFSGCLLDVSFGKICVSADFQRCQDSYRSGPGETATLARRDHTAGVYQMIPRYPFP